MSDPETPRPTPPTAPRTPFEPEKVRSGVGAGCGKPIAIGCGLFLLLFLVGAAILTVKAYDLLAWMIDSMGTEITGTLPDDVTAAEKERLAEAVAAASARCRSREVNPEALQRLQRGFVQISGKPEPDREDVLRFIELLEEFATSEKTVPP